MADTVMTTAGRVRGREIPGGVVFGGIPFAAPPVADRRFRPPHRPEPWDGLRDCRAFGPICPQAQSEGSGGVMEVFDSAEPMSEDCLTLNVWTPAADGARRPTMVWIHGGGFRSGSGSSPLYAGTAFVRDDVVLVTVNYRLHAFGFLYLDELFAGAEGTGVLGILDQIAALVWVRDNIASFGGDPDNVTVFGESAGAMSVCTLLGMGAATGLVRRAIAQSGAGHHALTSAAAGRVARRVLEILDVRPGDWEALRAVPTDALTRAAMRVAAEGTQLLAGEFSAAMPFQPVIDGVTLGARPIRAIGDGAAPGIDLLIGTCADELRIVAWGMPRAFQRRRLDPAVALVVADAGRSVSDVASAYATEWPGGSELDRHLAMETDYRYTVPAACLAERQLGHGARVWLYKFSWRTPVLGGVLGACHALDVPFVFEEQGHAPILLGDDPPQALVDAIHGAWVAFARTGDPGGGPLVDWPPYDVERRAVMDFDVVTRVVEDPRRDQRVLWDGAVNAWVHQVVDQGARVSLKD
jgi:para-nitrobenzyl esterase